MKRLILCTVAVAALGADLPRDTTVVKIGRPVVRTAATTTPIDLARALELAGVENPTIARAIEAVHAAEAELLDAKSLLLPTLNVGANFALHRGNLLSSGGVVLDVDRESLYAGAGARAIGAGTVTIPGVHLVSHVADAFFEPKAARQQVQGRQFDSEATRNRILLDVAIRYLRLSGATARVQALEQSERDLDEIVRLTANFARTGQGRQGDADRAQTEALLLRAVRQRAEGEVEVAAAALARLLNLDPAQRLRTAEDGAALLKLVDPGQPLEELLALARKNRPEVLARSADVALAETRLHQEKTRPFLPTVSVGFSGGDFGGGSTTTTPRFGRFDGRTDLDVLAFWSLDNLGLGNCSVVQQRRAEVGQALAELGQTINMVNREVSEAFARSQEWSRQLEVAHRRVTRAAEAFRLDLARVRNLQGRPIEVLNSVRLLATAREELIRAVVGADEAQLRLFVALGQPVTIQRDRKSTSTPRPSPGELDRGLTS